MKRYSIGIDPGFGEAALVLRDMDTCEPLEWYTWTAGTGDEFTRAVAMSQVIVDTIVRITDDYDIDELYICIEMHVYKQNPPTYRMQSRLLEEIEAGIWIMVTPLVDQVWLIEHMPGTAKLLATGDGKASKRRVVESAAKWFSRYEWTELTVSSREALADAWAHSLVADVHRDPSGTQVITSRDLTNLRAHTIRAIAEGRADE